MRCLRFLIFALLIGIASEAARGQVVLFSDDLSLGTGWKYSHFGGTDQPDANDISSAAFGFDYSALGIPEAPHSLPGDPVRRGLRLDANVPAQFGGDQIAAVYEHPDFTGQYTVQVDVWMNWSPIASGAGTTEHVGVMAGFKTASAQRSFSPGLNGGGVIFAGDADSGCGTDVCDIMLVKDGTHLDLASGQYGETSFGGSNQTGYNHSNSNANLNLPSLFPSFSISSATGGLNATGTQPAGALGFQWITVTLEVDTLALGAGPNSHLGTVKVTLESARSGNSFVLGTIDNSIEQNPNDGINTYERPVNLEGGIGLVMTDFFGSGPSNPTFSFGLFDNVRVYEGFLDETLVSERLAIPEPAAIALITVVAVAGCLLRSGRCSCRWLLMLACGFAAFFPAPTFAALNIYSDFDHASLASWSGNLSSIQLQGRENYLTSTGWRWMYFEAEGVAGTQPQFSLNQAFAGGNAALNNHKMVYSYDNENWFFFDNNQRSSNLYTFSNNTPFTGNNVFVAYAQPYSYGRSVDHTAEVLASPWAAPTVSGDANGVLGQSSVAFDDIGRLVPARNVYGYRITDPATDSAVDAKRKVMLSSGLHAGETLGTYTYEGLINWLISDDARAARLREDAEFLCYPVLNPGGRFAGSSRGTVDHITVDPNGRWNPSLWGTYAEIKATGEAMLADVVSTPGTLDVFIDFHSTIPAAPGDDFGFIEYEQGDNLADFWVELRSIQPNILQTDSTGTSWTSANFADLLLGAEVDITFETQFGKNRPISYYHNMGANFGIAFYNAWIRVDDPAEADFDEDGDVDDADLAAWQNSYSLSASAEHWHGDANGDGDVDGRDFLVWQRQYTGSIDSLAGVNTVPESTSIVLLLIGITPLSRKRCRLRLSD
jgi:hypothetical protein